MIEVVLMPNGLYRWFMICEQGRQLVIGTDHPTDFEANAHAKAYRSIFWKVCKLVDDYTDPTIRGLTQG